jgi:hypothetical protein
VLYFHIQREGSGMKFEQREFRKERVNLNGNDFDHCQFFECEMVFNGVGNVGLTNCGFNNCRWTFEGPAAATAAFMKALYSMDGGGRDLILATFKDVAPDLKFRH